MKLYSDRNVVWTRQRQQAVTELHQSGGQPRASERASVNPTDRTQASPIYTARGWAAGAAYDASMPVTRQASDDYVIDRRRRRVRRDAEGARDAEDRLSPVRQLVTVHLSFDGDQPTCHRLTSKSMRPKCHWRPPGRTVGRSRTHAICLLTLSLSVTTTTTTTTGCATSSHAKSNASSISQSESHELFIKGHTHTHTHTHTHCSQQQRRVHKCDCRLTSISPHCSPGQASPRRKHQSTCIHYYSVMQLSAVLMG